MAATKTKTTSARNVDDYLSRVPEDSRVALEKLRRTIKSMVPDAVLKVGDDLMLQVTRYTSPCVNITRSFLHGDYSRVSQKRHPGWSRVYARVLVPGSVSTGDAVRLLSEAEARPIVGSLRL